MTEELQEQVDRMVAEDLSNKRILETNTREKLQGLLDTYQANGIKDLPSHNVELMIPQDMTVPRVDEVQKIPEGTKILVANFGGTNWGLGTQTWNGVKWMDEIESKKLKVEETSAVKTLDDLADLMVGKIAAKAAEIKDYQGVAISIGFPGESKAEGNNVDMRITRASKDFANCPAIAPGKPGISILQKLREKGITVPVTIANDSVALALDVTASSSEKHLLPVAFVIGTGMNVVMELTRPVSTAGQETAESHLINTEIGQSLALPETDVSRMAAELGLLPQGANSTLTEVIQPSGRYLMPQWAAQLHLKLNNEALNDTLPNMYAGHVTLNTKIDQVKNNQDLAQACVNLVKENGNQGEVLSKLTSGEIDKEWFESIVGYDDIDPYQFQLIKETASEVMRNSAMNMAILLAPIINFMAGEIDPKVEVLVNCSGTLVKEDQLVIVATSDSGVPITYRTYLENALQQITRRNVKLNSASETRGIATLCATKLELI